MIPSSPLPGEGTQVYFRTAEKFGILCPSRRRVAAGVRSPTTVKRKERQTTMQHMQLENRQRLGFLASLGWTMRRIAEDMGWSSQAISDELRNRRVDSDMPFAERSRTPYDVFIEKHGAKGKASRRRSPPVPASVRTSARERDCRPVRRRPSAPAPRRSRRCRRS